MKNRGLKLWAFIKRHAFKIYNASIDWLHHKATSLYSRLKKWLIKKWHKLRALRWHDVRHAIVDAWYTSVDYLRSTPPKEIALDAYDLLRTILDRIWSFLTKNWKRRAITITFIIGYTAYAVFANIIASPERMQTIYQENYDTSVVLVDEVVELYTLIDEPPEDGELTILVEDTATELVEAIEPLSFNDPHEWIVSFSVRDFLSGSDEAERVTTLEGNVILHSAIEELNEHIDITYSINAVLEIDEPAQNVPTFQNALRALERKLDNKEFSAVDTSRIRRITRLLIAETDEFTFLGDRQRFEANAADFQDELAKAVLVSWDELRIDLLNQASALKFDYQRFNSFLLNNLEK